MTHYICALVLLLSGPGWVAAQEIVYAPPEFKVSAPHGLDVSPVLMTDFPATIDGEKGRFLALVLVFWDSKQRWSGTMTTDNVIATAQGRKVPARLVGMGQGASLTTRGFSQPARLVLEKTGIVVGSGNRQVRLDPVLALKLQEQNVDYRTESYPAQFWFIFPYAGGRDTIQSIRIDTIELAKPASPKLAIRHLKYPLPILCLSFLRLPLATPS